MMPYAGELFDVPAGKIGTIVTSLEMRARPALRALPPQPGFALRRVERPEPQWFRDLYRHIGENWLWFMRLKMPDEALIAIIQHPARAIYTLVHDGRDEGLIELDFAEKGDCELAFFGVSPPFVGTAAGRWLMNEAVRLAWAQPIGRFWVHTCTFDHPSALAFYIRSGFAPFRQQVEISDDPRLDGTLPRTAAPHVPIIEG
jgi:GNAT superfamily N-acetyltransferase